MAWQPQEEGLKQVLSLLKLSMAPDTSAQKAVHEQFEELSVNPEFCKYLMFVVAKMPNEDETVRSRSCLNVKNIVRRYHGELKGDVLEYLKQLSLTSIGDESSLVRKTVGTLIATIVAVETLSCWPELLPCLLALLETNEPNVCEGAMNALQKICEDSQELSKDPDSPLNHFVVKFINFLGHSNNKIRCCAVTCINTFIHNRSSAFTQNLDYFMRMLFELAVDNDVDVCKQVCRAFVMLLEQKVDNLLPHMKGIIEYMIAKTQDENVALEACEFWHCLTDQQQLCKEVLKPFLPRLIPVLVNNMKFTEIEIVLLKGDAEDESIADRDEDIKPRFHKARTHDTCDREMNTDDGCSDDEEMLADWNIRKSSAAALDASAHIFKEDLLPIMLPILKEVLFHSDWVIKESGILALGAISEGCMIGISPHLNELIPYLIDCINHKKSLIRVITCWTLSRYYDWILSDPRNLYLDPILSGLLDKMLDQNKKVQESACSALAKLEELASAKLINRLEVILKTFVYAYSKYQRKNLTLLYDAVGTLANYVGNHLNSPEYINLLMPPLIEKWNQTNDDDKGLFCLFECITSIAIALKGGFIPFTEPIYKRSIILIEKTLNQQIAKEKDPKNFDLPDPEVDFIVCSLDMISGLLSALNENMDSLIRNSNCLPLLYQCMQNSSPEVRQSSFSLLGDMARNCFSCIYPHLGNFIPIVIYNINPQYLSVCNNATWAIGEICTKITFNELYPFIDLIIKQLLHIINSGNRILIEISAIALGRLGNVCPIEVGNVLEHFSKLWCLSAGNIRDCYEKESTFKGMCQIVAINPYGILRDLHLFCNAIASWDDPGELKEMFAKVLQGYKNQFGEENWKKFIDPFSEPLRERLAMYQV